MKKSTPIVTTRRLAARLWLSLAVTLLLLPQLAAAQVAGGGGGGQGLPQVAPPTNGGGGGGGILSTVQGYLADGGVLVGLVLATAAFLVVGGGAVGSFEQSRQRGEWGQFAVVVVLGAALVVLVIWLATQASQIL